MQDRVERNFEIVIQACIDVGLHVLADLPRPLPETDRAVFDALVNEAILPRDLGGELGKMAGFRNLLAHGSDSFPRSAAGPCGPNGPASVKKGPL